MISGPCDLAYMTLWSFEEVERFSSPLIAIGRTKFHFAEAGAGLMWLRLRLAVVSYEIRNKKQFAQEFLTSK